MKTHQSPFTQELLCIITVGDEKQGGPGQLVVTGQADIVQAVGKMWVFGDDDQR